MLNCLYTSLSVVHTYRFHVNRQLKLSCKLIFIYIHRSIVEVLELAIYYTLPCCRYGWYCVLVYSVYVLLKQLHEHHTVKLAAVNDFVFRGVKQRLYKRFHLLSKLWSQVFIRERVYIPQLSLIANWTNECVTFSISEVWCNASTDFILLLKILRGLWMDGTKTVF